MKLAPEPQRRKSPRAAVQKVRARRKASQKPDMKTRVAKTAAGRTPKSLAKGRPDAAKTVARKASTRRSAVGKANAKRNATTPSDPLAAKRADERKNDAAAQRQRNAAKGAFAKGGAVAKSKAKKGKK